MSDPVLYKAIFRRSAPRSILLLPGQLLPGQAAFADDTNELIYRKRLNASVNGGSLVFYPANAGGSAGYIHDQMVPADIWTVNHNLGHRPHVSVTLSDGSEVGCEVRHINDNTLTIILGIAISGTAYLT